MTQPGKLIQLTKERFSCHITSCLTIKTRESGTCWGVFGFQGACCSETDWAAICLWEVMHDYLPFASSLHLLNCLYQNPQVFTLLAFFPILFDCGGSQAERKCLAADQSLHTTFIPSCHTDEPKTGLKHKDINKQANKKVKYKHKYGAFLGIKEKQVSVSNISSCHSNVS